MPVRPAVERRLADRRRSTTTGITVGPGARRRLGRGLAVLLVLSGLGHVAATMLPDAVDFPGRSLLAVLDLGSERAIGTWVTSLLHLACALLSAAAALVARQERSRWARNWWLLAAAFALMSLDEVAALHDRLTGPIRNALGTTGVFYYAWIIPVLLLGLVFLAVQVRFLRHLGAPTGRDLVLAGLVFVLGAGGLEMAEGLLATRGGEGSALFHTLILLEELMELGALMWVVCILLRHLVETLGRPRITITPTTTADVV